MATYPGNYAVPGLMWPARAVPGLPVPGGVPGNCAVPGLLWPGFALPALPAGSLPGGGMPGGGSVSACAVPGLAWPGFIPPGDAGPVTTYPGNYAVPGLMWPGFARPALPAAGGTAPPPPPATWQFTGLYPLTYPQYIDASTEQALQVVPGGTYDITPVGGDPGVTDPPGDGRWQPAT